MDNYRILERMGKFYIQHEVDIQPEGFVDLFIYLFRMATKKPIPKQWAMIGIYGSFNSLGLAKDFIELIKKGDIIHTL